MNLQQRMDWLEEFDHLTQVVGNSKSKLYQQNLLIWFEFLDDEPIAARVLGAITKDLDFPKWLNELNAAEERELIWPLQKGQRLAAQVQLFREFATGREDPFDFAMNHLLSDNDFDAAVYDLNDQIFQPLVVDLRRMLQRELTNDQNPLTIGDIPASDRTVAISHNSADGRKMEADLAELQEAVRGTNDFTDVDDKSQALAELSATRELLKSVKVRVDPLISLAYRCLRHIAKKFADTAVGAAAVALLALIGRVTGLW